SFRPSVVAQELSEFDVVNVGASGTFVVRKPGPTAKFRAALLRKLPFTAAIAICKGEDVLAIERDNPFKTEPLGANITRFVSIMPKSIRGRVSTAISLPATGPWSVRVIAVKKQFVFGTYRRHMKTISYLGKMDELFGMPLTTRNWNTMTAIVQILKGHRASKAI
ncbi:MAG: hypothetical protein ACXVZX_13350, partial [Terriglobales bacterium]